MIIHKCFYGERSQFRGGIMERQNPLHAAPM